ncbi:MAG: ABC transporter permease, partial [Gammaproteobacteria bacterium]|nr:ABC transporter permease [Gammaproteobacteria bacterium]
MSRTRETWLRSLSLLGFLVIWQLAAMAVNKPLLPAPTIVLTSLWNDLTGGSMLYHLGITLARVAVSFLIAMALGTALGIVMGRY